MNENDFQNIGTKKNKKIYAFNIILIIAIFIAIFTYIISVEGLDNIKNLLQHANYWWVLLGLFCLVCMWIAEAITIHFPLKKLYPN